MKQVVGVLTVSVEKFEEEEGGKDWCATLK